MGSSIRIAPRIAPTTAMPDLDLFLITLLDEPRPSRFQGYGGSHFGGTLVSVRDGDRVKMTRVLRVFPTK